jgi:hypothetical protein
MSVFIPISYLFLRRNDVHTLAAVDYIKHYNPIGRSKQGVISASAYVKAGLDAGAMLADQDITRKHKLACVAFYAQALGIAISSVAA